MLILVLLSPDMPCFCSLERKAMIWNWCNYLTSFRSKTPKGKKDALKTMARQSKHYQKKAKRTVYFFSKFWPNGYPKQTKIDQDIHAKTYNDRSSKPQQKHYLGTGSKIFLEGEGGVGEGLNRFYVATTLALISAVILTRPLFSPHEGSLTLQCNNSENIKIKRIQRWNNDEDSTARNTWNLKQMKTNRSTAVGPTRARASDTYLKVFRPKPS